MSQMQFRITNNITEDDFSVWGGKNSSSSNLPFIPDLLIFFSFKLVPTLYQAL